VELGESVVRVPLLRRKPVTAFRVFWGSNFMTLSRAFCEHLFQRRPIRRTLPSVFSVRAQCPRSSSSRRPS
jgi:hypothetical protein